MAILKFLDFRAGSKFTIKLPQDIVGVSRYDRESQNCDWVLFSVTPLFNLAHSLLTGGINFFCKKSLKEIYHVMANARNSNFGAFSIKSKLSSDALKFRVFALKFDF